MAKKTRVFWTEEEVDKVARVMYRYLKEGMHLKDAIDKSQREALPQERWRSLVQPTGAIKAVRPMLDKLRKEEAKQKAAEELQAKYAPKVEIEQPAPPITQSLPVFEEPAPQELLNPRPKAGWREIILDMGREVIVAAATDPRFRSVMVGLLAEIVPQVIEEIATSFGMKPKPTEELPPHVVPPKANMETIAVIGLLPRQQQEIRKNYGDRFDLRMVEAGAKASHIKGMTRGAAVCYLMADFINHSDQQLMTSIGVPKAFVNGSVSALEEALENRLDTQRRRGGNGAGRVHA